MLTWLALIPLLATSAPPAPTALAGSPDGAIAAVVRGEVLLRPATSAGEEAPMAAAPVLKGKGAVEAIAFGGDGALFVVRGRRLGRRGPDGAERWTPIGGRGPTAAFAADTKTIVWLGERGYRVSTDGGATFQDRPEWPVGSFDNRVFVADGDVQLIAAWEASCGGGYQERFGGLASDAALAPLRWDLDVSVGFVPGPRRFVFVETACGEDGETKLCAIGDSPLEHDPVALPHPAPTGAALLAAPTRDAVWLALGPSLVRQEGLDTMIVETRVPDGTTHLAVAGNVPVIVARGEVLQLDGREWVRVDGFGGPAAAKRRPKR